MQRFRRCDCLLGHMLLLIGCVCCRYFDAFIENDKLFIVTELARGGDIGAKVRFKRPMRMTSVVSRPRVDRSDAFT